MLTEDYIIRMINLAIAAILRIVGLKQKGSYEEALELIDLTVQQLTGLRPHLLKHLDDERLYFVLTRNNQLDSNRLELIADLLNQEGDIFAAQGRAAEAQDDYVRVLRYYLEVYFNRPDEDRVELRQKIELLARGLGIEAPGADTLWPLAGYYEEVGAYQRAEQVYQKLASQPGLRESVLPELRAFYQRLLEKTSADLAAGGVDKDRIIKELQSR